MVKLVDTQRSDRCGSNPMGVQVPLRAQLLILTLLTIKIYGKTG